MSSEGGQVLAFFAIAVPLVLLPVAAYAVDATLVAGRESALQAATAEAAETAAQQINVAGLRSSGALSLDAAAARLVLEQTLVEEEPGTSIDSYTITGAASQCRDERAREAALQRVHATQSSCTRTRPHAWLLATTIPFDRCGPSAASAA